MNVFDLAAVLTLDSSQYEEGLEQASEKTGDMKKGLADAGKTVAKAAVGLGAIGGAAFAFANKVSGTGDQIDKMSQKLGMSTTGYQEWAHILEHSGSDISTLTGVMKTLNKAVEGGSEAFDKLGISQEEAASMTQEELFERVIKELQGMEEGAERTALATDLLGRGAQELAPLLNTSAEDVEKMKQDLHDLGGVMSEEAVKDSAAFQDSVTDLKAAFGGATNELAKELIPAIKSLVDKITNWLKGGGLQRLIDLFKKLKPVIIAVTAAIVAYKAAMAISSVMSAASNAVKMFSAAQAAMNAVLSANPIAAVIALIAGLVAGIMILWNNCEGFREAVTNIFGFLSEFLGGIIEGVKLAFSQAWEAIQSVWSGVVGFFSGIWEGISGAFAAVGEFFGGIFSGAWDAITGVFSAIGDWFEERWKDIKKVFAGISGFFRTVFEGARDAIRTVWNAVISIVKTPVNALIDLLNIFIRGLNKIKVPDWVPAIGGYGIHIPEIPNLEQGGILKKGQLGLLEGNGAEAVIPLDQNKKWVASIVAEMQKQGAGGAPTGDIIIPVSIGQRKIETIVIEANRINAYRSGGR